MNPPDRPDAPPADFLARLLDAMRETAERSRMAALAGARAEADRLVEEARRRSAAESEELERRADEGAAAITAWHATELARLRAEADQRLAEHQEQQVHASATQREATQRRILAIQAQLAEFEAVLARFFTELERIDDPATFVAAAARMPATPRLEPTEATEPAAAAPASGPGGSVTTSVAVAGHESFGAVTSVKQALERVPGIVSVELGLGESGEFVLTATHDPALDLRGAIDGLGLRGVRVEGEPGALRVALGPPA